MSIEENTNGNMQKPDAPPGVVQNDGVQKHERRVDRTNNRKTGGVYRFFRSVFSHIVFAMFVVTGALGYLLHARMIAVVGDTVMSDKYLGNYIHNQGKIPASAVSQPPSSQKAETSTSGSKAVVAAVAPPAQPPESNTASVPKVTPTASVPKAKPQITTTEPKKKSPPVVAVSPPVVAEKSKAELPQNTASPQSVTTIKKNQPLSNHASLVKSWQLARQYYSAGKPEAEAAYLALIKGHPDNPDLAGELGNIYYNAGKLSQAGEQYYNAAIIQLNGSRPGLATCILGVLERIDIGKARALRVKLTRACPRR